MDNSWQEKLLSGSIKTANSVAAAIAQPLELPSGWATVKSAEGNWLMRHPSGFASPAWTPKEGLDFCFGLKNGIVDQFVSLIQCYKARLRAKDDLQWVDDRLRFLASDPDELMDADDAG